jgi:hypothetical protein
MQLIFGKEVGHMGSSSWQNIGYSVGLIQEVDPFSILDVGIGFGKWGFLSREFLDGWAGREPKEMWQRRIDGVEVFPAYIQEHQRFLYSNIYLGNVLDVLPTLSAYDLIICGDVVEHFEKEDGLRLLRMCVQKSKHVLVHIPIGDAFGQNAINGNEHERHLSQWNNFDKNWKSDFSEFQVVHHKGFYDFLNRPFFVYLLKGEIT